jgi:hypothetical protein
LWIADCGLPNRARIPALVGLIVCLVLVACRQVPPLPESALHDLTSLDQFRQAFNADADRARLLVIISPT